MINGCNSLLKNKSVYFYHLISNTFSDTTLKDKILHDFNNIIF